MPGMSGTDLLSKARAEWPNTIRMILTGKANLETALKAINEGQLSRFMLKPINDLVLLGNIKSALEERHLKEDNSRLKLDLEKKTSLLDKLEEEHPGITEIKRDPTGGIILEE
jgi:DNA-binding NtrC family response regulator